MKFNREQALDMYTDLVFGRAMANKIVEYIYGGRINGAIHPSLGQEAISAGILEAKKLTSHEIYTHCTHRQQPLIARTVGLDPFLGELMNRRTGLMKGTSGEYHLVSLKDNHLPMQGILGAGVANATGFAWALKLDGKDGVVVCSCGDGAMSEGIVYESINLAAINHLPIVYLIENNGIAMSTPIELQAPHQDLYLRAAGFNIPGFKVDGNDVEAMTQALLGAIETAAAGQPVLVEAKTTRWTGHYVGDMQKYRDTSFLNDTSNIDPVVLYEKKLTAAGTASEQELADIKAAQETLMADAFQRAWEAEAPTKEDCVNYNNLYSNNAGGEL